jgi:hypothetical protein
MALTHVDSTLSFSLLHLVDRFFQLNGIKINSYNTGMPAYTLAAFFAPVNIKP